MNCFVQIRQRGCLQLPRRDSCHSNGGRHRSRLRSGLPTILRRTIQVDGRLGLFAGADFNFLQIYRHHGSSGLCRPHEKVRAVLRGGLHSLPAAAGHGEIRQKILQLNFCDSVSQRVEGTKS